MSQMESKQAAILNIGTELLVGHVLNTHAQYLTKWLNHMGYSVHHHLSCGDNGSRIQSALGFLAQSAQLILITGGLGPTQDDITRREVACFLGLPLERRAEVVDQIKAQFDRWGRQATENNYLQADFPVGAVVLDNPKGTAPGFVIEHDGLVIACLPGPPVEVKAVAEGALANYLAGSGKSLYSQYLSLYGIGESALDERIADLFEAQTDPTIGIYASEGMLTLRLSTVKPDSMSAQAVIAPVVAAIRQRVSEFMVSEDGLSIPEALLQVLTTKGKTLALAESCSGGWIAKLMTDMPGASKCLLGSVVAYSNDAKISLLGVSQNTLEVHGAVSEPTAIEMAVGALGRLGADCALAVTGIAGPEGGTEAKPVGTVCFALAVKEGDTLSTESWTQRLPGDRNRVRLHTSLTALRRLHSAVCTL